MSVPREGACALRSGSLPAYVRSALHALLSLPELSAADRKRLRHQPADRSRPRGAARGRSAADRRASRRRQQTVQRIYRCPTCQVAVFSEYGRPEVRFVRGGTLDQPSGVTPDVHIFTRSKLSWITLPDSVPAFEVDYDMKALWPAASLERLEAIVAPAESDA